MNSGSDNGAVSLQHFRPAGFSYVCSQISDQHFQAVFRDADTLSASLDFRIYLFQVEPAHLFDFAPLQGQLPNIHGCVIYIDGRKLIIPKNASVELFLIPASKRARIVQLIRHGVNSQFLLQLSPGRRQRLVPGRNVAGR